MIRNPDFFSLPFIPGIVNAIRHGIIRPCPSLNHLVFIIEQVKGFLNSKSGSEEIKINQDLYMIGYNAGLVLGVTQQGIKVQLTSGKLTQTPDGQRLLYSIPTVQGSSGSPVIDAYGKFVGVNFAKLNGSDNFNFGIPVKKVVKFLNE